MKKLIFKIVIFFILAIIFFIIGVDVSLAEIIADNKVDEVLDSIEKNESSKSTKEKSPFVDFARDALNYLWTQKYYILGGVIILFVGYAVFSSNGTPPSEKPQVPEQLLLTGSTWDLPPLKSQTIEELYQADSRFTTSREASLSFPDIITPSKLYYPSSTADVADIRFPVGMRDAEGHDFYLLRVGTITPYDQLTADFWIKHAADYNGVKVGAVLDNNYQLMYSKVAVLPADTIHYNIYHKVDIVSVVPDPQAPNNLGVELPVKASILFKDNEVNWKQ